MFKWICYWIRYVVVADLYHGYSILWSCSLNWWSLCWVVVWRTKMNFWCMRLLTEFSTWLNELDLVGFLFSCCGCVSQVVWEKTGFSCEMSMFKRFFTNKWLCEVLENDFWDGWNLNFSIDYDRAKRQKRVGENDIKIRLTVWILCAKWWKRKSGKKAVLSVEHGRARAGHGPCVHFALFGTTVCARHEPCVLSGLRFSRFFVLFHPFLFWIGIWCKHESFR